MNKLVGIYILTLLSLSACRKGAPDGTYCADVAFKNADTGKKVNYALVVEVKDQQLVQIVFPKGHSDTSSIPATKISDKGTCTVMSAAGQLYNVKMKGPAEKCLDASNMVQCLGHSKDGDRCKRMSDKPNGFCWQHQSQASGK
jgi:hypothetical protein